MKSHVLIRRLRLAHRPWARLRRTARSHRTRARRLSHPRCDSIQQWTVSTPGAAIELVRPRVTVRRPRPSTSPSINEAYDYFLSLPEEYVVPERHLARIPGGCLVGDRGLLVLPNGAVSTESVYEHLYGESGLTQAPISAGQGERFVEGNFYSLLNRFAADHNYYHWLHDVVIPLHDVLDHLPSDVRFVVPRQRRGFQDDSLAIIGVTGERLWEYDASGPVRLENLYFAPPPPLTMGRPISEAWFRDKALEAYSVEPRVPSRRIYISRRAARYRRVVNEEEIEQLLRGYDFDVYHLEDWSFRDQVALFAEAAAVVSAHGSGLMNMIFSPPGLVVVDIFESNQFNKYFWNLTAALGHRYWPMAGRSVPSGDSYASDLELAPKVLREVVEQALGAVCVKDL
jgi:hypothetical protein